LPYNWKGREEEEKRKRDGVIKRNDQKWKSEKEEKDER
jgi:hypothetical protein